MFDSNLELTSNSEVDPQHRMKVSVPVSGDVKRFLTPDGLNKYNQDINNFNMISESSDVHFDENFCELNSSSEVVPRPRNVPISIPGKVVKQLTPDHMKEIENGKISYTSSEIDNIDRAIPIHTSSAISSNASRSSLMGEKKASSPQSSISSQLDSEGTFQERSKNKERKVKVNHEPRKGEPNMEVEQTGDFTFAKEKRQKDDAKILSQITPELKEKLKDPKFRKMAAAHIAALALAGYTTFYASKEKKDP